MSTPTDNTTRIFFEVNYVANNEEHKIQMEDRLHALIDTLLDTIDSLDYDAPDYSSETLSQPINPVVPSGYTSMAQLIARTATSSPATTYTPLSSHNAQARPSTPGYTRLVR